MPDPLVLYAPGIDPRAGAEQIRERWAGAELVALVADYDSDDQAATLFGHVWCLGVPAPQWAEPDVRCTVIDPTPTASIAMQVWGLLNPTCELECVHDQPRHKPHVCKLLSAGCRDNPPSPPTWLRYLDDAVTERWDLPDSRAWWAWATNLDPDEAVRRMMEPDKLGAKCAAWVMVGRAILRARERCPGCRNLNRQLNDASGEILQLHETIDRLRTERNELQGKLRQETRQAIDRRREVVALRERLAEEPHA